MKRFLSVFLVLALLLASLTVAASAAEEEGFHWDDGKPYYVNSDGSRLKGWKELTETWTDEESGETHSWKYWIYGKSNGFLAYEEWMQQGADWYYFSGYSMAKDGTYTIGENEYALFDESGKWIVSGKKAGWMKNGNDWYYLEVDSDEWGTWGWFYMNGNWKVNDKAYYFDKQGRLVTKVGWQSYQWTESDTGKQHTDWYYVTNANGELATGWKKMGKDWYYFSEWGWMYNDNFYWDWPEEADKPNAIYAFSKSGVMETNKWCSDTWYYEDGTTSTAWMYMGPTGAAKMGWFKVADKWYYSGDYGWIWMDSWLEDGGKMYYFDKTGAMVTGWQKLDGNWYFFNKTSGAMVEKDWVKDGNTWYYMKEYGVMAANETLTIGGTAYKFGADGAWIQ